MQFRDRLVLVACCFAFVIGAYGDHCFRNRIPRGNAGACNTFIRSDVTQAWCCSHGGAGWTERLNGKRCRDACDGVQLATTEPPVATTTESEDETVHNCFRTREARGIAGQCEDLIGETTKGSCCRQGGHGWTEKTNGKRCGDACEGVNLDDGPTKHCFEARNERGRCRRSAGVKTKLACCQEGGVGWAENENGRQCESACEQQVQQPVDGGWSDWDTWSLCSVTCAEGQQSRERRCDNPAPQHGGADCVGESTEIAWCVEGPCPINGMWGAWGSAGECDATCQSDAHPVYRLKNRICDNPPPQHGGLNCVGPSKRRVRCNVINCPIDGGWSEYGDWSQCSQTCGDGIETRERRCDSPPPQYGGSQCVGVSSETRDCHNRRPCPIHGGWAEWGPFTPCDAPKCGVDGTSYRSRVCTNPRPRYGGNYCIGDIIDRVSCSVCAVWEEWSDWGPCNRGCRRGSFRLRYRQCDGSGCQGEFRDMEECEGLDPCPEFEGSGSGSGSGSMTDFPCDDEAGCNPVGGDGASVSYSYVLNVVDDDSQCDPVIDKDCEVIVKDSYSYSLDDLYNNPVGEDLEENVVTPQNDNVNADGGESISYSDGVVNEEEVPSIPAKEPQNDNVNVDGGDSNSYSMGDDAVNEEVPSIPTQEPQNDNANGGDSGSYSMDGVVDDQPPQPEENDESLSVSDY